MTDRPIDQRPPNPIGDARPSEPAPADLVRRRKTVARDAAARAVTNNVRQASSTIDGASAKDRASTKDAVSGTNATNAVGASSGLERRTHVVRREGGEGSRRRSGQTARCLDAFLNVRPHDPNVVTPHEQERTLQELLDRLDCCDRNDGVARKARRVIRSNLQLLRLYRQHANALIGG